MPDPSVPSVLEEMPEGGVMVTLDPQAARREERSDHQENLALTLDPGVLRKIGSSLQRAIEDDLESRKEWEGMLVEGLSQLGLTYEEKEFPFSGACGVYSSAFMQAVITFVSNAAAELLPPDGPTLCTIRGQSTPELDDQADRVTAWMNLYLTKLAPEYYPDWEQALMWLAIYGNVFKKVYQDPILERPVTPYVKPQDLIVNYGTVSLASATRVTHVLHMTKKDIKLRQQSGFYADISLTAQNDLLQDPSEISEKLNEISGFSPPDFEYTQDYKLYECHADLEIEGLNHENDKGEKTGIPLPYLVTLESETGTVLALYRNWREDDTTFRKRNYFVQGCYFPGLGFYGLGLAHLTGGNAKASTMIQRQLIDAGTLSNFPGGLRAKGMRLETNNVRVGPTEFVEIDTGGLPIDQAVMMMPYKDPSSIMYEMKKELEQTTLQLAGAVNQPYGDFNPNAPVGTTLALLEQSHRVQSGVMRRLHRAMGEELQLIFDLFGEHLPQKPYPFQVPGGSHVIMRKDFHPTLSIQPVSDPNISNSTQRLVRAEAILKFAQGNPELHDLREAYDHVYRELKVSAEEIEKILPPPQPPQETVPLDPLTENQNVTQGKPVKAALWQNHEAHIQVHSLLIGTGGPSDPALQAHIQEHQAYQQQVEIQQKIPQKLPDDLTKLPPEVQNQIAAQMAHAAEQIQKEQQAQQPPPPVDPGTAMMKDIEMKAHANEQKLQIEQMKIQMDAQFKQMQLQQKTENDAMKMQLEAMKLQPSPQPQQEVMRP